MIAARFAMVVLVCMARSVYWITEQPSSSLAQFLPYLELALNPAKVVLGFAPGLVQKLSLDCIEGVCPECDRAAHAGNTRSQSSATAFRWVFRCLSCRFWPQLKRESKD